MTPDEVPPSGSLGCQECHRLLGQVMFYRSIIREFTKLVDDQQRRLDGRPFTVYINEEAP